MGITRSDLFSAEQNELAGLAKVLGHPARIAIIQYLIEAKSCINSDLVEELGLAQATISQHLRELKTVGIIQGSIEGTSVCYCINPARWAKIQSQFETLFSTFSNQNNCC